MVPAIMARVCGLPADRLVSQPATLDGHRRHPVRGEDYPGLVPATGDSVPPVPGVLYTGLPASVWSRLDEFEGGEYERVAVTVHTAAGAAVPAWVYRFRAACADRLAPGEWDAEAFEREGRARFEARYLGFGRLEPPGD